MTIQFPHMPEQVTRSEAEIIDYISNNPGSSSRTPSAR